MIKRLSALLILLSCLTAEALDLKADMNRVRNFLLQSKAVTVNFTLTVDHPSNTQNQRLSGRIFKYEDTYCTDFNNRLMINNNKHNLIIDHNQEMIFIRKALKEEEIYEESVQASINGFDSILNSSGFTKQVEVLGNGRTHYKFMGGKDNYRMEMWIGPEFIEKIEYDMPDDKGRLSTVTINYSYKKSVDPAERKSLKINTYLNLENPQNPVLSTQYSNYGLVNNLIL